MSASFQVSMEEFIEISLREQISNPGVTSGAIFDGAGRCSCQWRFVDGNFLCTSPRVVKTAPNEEQSTVESARGRAVWWD